MSSDNGDNKIRLQKFLASAGIGSRRHCEELIEKGRVCVDGDVVNQLGAMVDPHSQKIEVNGTYLKPEPKRYYLLHKPAGYLCTNNDPDGRPLAVDLIAHEHYRLFTVGRLDENSAGLLLVTNDGELANRLAHPRYHITRTYEVQVAGRPTPEILDSLRDGMWFSDGFFKVSRVKQLRRRGNSTFLEVDLHEGKNREVRRLFARVGHKVMYLQRVRFGPLRLGRLGLGKYRSLTKGEFAALMELLENPRGSEEKQKTATAGSSKPKSSGKSPRKKKAHREELTGKSRRSTRGASRFESPGKKKGPVGKKKAARKKVKSKPKPQKRKPSAGKTTRKKRK